MITIDLGPNQSRLLSEAAPEFTSVFAVACRQSHPEDPQRFRLHLIPSTVAIVGDAMKVISGEMKATKLRKTSSAG